MCYKGEINFTVNQARQASGAKTIEIECGAAFNLTSGLVETT
jgi:hypothetical protein